MEGPRLRNCSVTAQDNVVEPLHGTVELELELASVFFGETVGRLHVAHPVDPAGHCVKSLVVRRKVWVDLQCLLNVSERWQQFVDRADVERDDVHRSDKLRCDIKDPLRQVSVRLLAVVVRLARLEQCFGRLAVLDAVHFHESVQPHKVLDRLLAELVLVVECAELIVVLRTRDFPRSVSELLHEPPSFKQE